MKPPEYYALNRYNKTITRMSVVGWQQLSTWFRMGIKMPDGDIATGIGRCPKGELEKRAAESGFKVI